MSNLLRIFEKLWNNGGSIEWISRELAVLKCLVACFPKSGSTYLTELIGRLDGFSKVSWVPAYGRREQELDEHIIANVHGATHQVAQHHVRASEHLMDIIHRHSITLIVLVRNIFDYIASLADRTEQITNASDSIERDNIRFNVGVAGRELDQLTAAQVDRIRRLTRHYRGVDFSLIGL